MIKFGCLARYFNKYSDEVGFAKNNGFMFMQLWYDKNGIALKKDSEPLEVIKQHEFPTIIHAVLDMNEIEEHIPKLIKIMKYLEHGDLIIHPICKSEQITNKTIFKLAKKIKWANKLLSKENIALYIENNSKLDPIFNTVEEIDILFKENPEVDFVLDVAHIDNYKHLKDMIRIKMPKILHVADRNLDIIHEHLPIGMGNINYKYIFTSILPDFKGRIIFEIIQSSEDIIDSKARIEEYCNW